MNKFLRVLLELLIVGILTQFFVYCIAPLLLDLLCIYFNIDLVFFMDFTSFYQILIIVCWFFYFLFLFFQLIARFLLDYKHGKKLLYLICLFFFFIYLL